MAKSTLGEIAVNGYCVLSNNLYKKMGQERDIVKLMLVCQHGADSREHVERSAAVIATPLTKGQAMQHAGHTGFLGRD